MTATSTTTSRSPRALVLTLLLGLASAGLYTLLFIFSDRLPELAELSRQGGHTFYALVPLGIVDAHAGGPAFGPE